MQPKTSYRKEINGRIAAAGCKTRKDSVKFIDTLITASPDFFKGKNRAEVKDYFDRAADFLSRKIGAGNIFTAVIHLDEKTPHMHLCFTPITEDGRLSAKDIIGNKAKLTKWQDDFWKHMVAAYPDLERGESASKTGRRHIPMRVFKQAVRLTRKAARIQDELNAITPINAGKKRDEILALLERFFPDLEDFESRVRTYKSEFDRLERENAALERRMEASKQSVTDRMGATKLQSELESLRRVVAAIPDEYKRQLLAQTCRREGIRGAE